MDKLIQSANITIRANRPPDLSDQCITVFQQGDFLQLTVQTKGCQFSANGSCSMCNYGCGQEPDTDKLLKELSCILEQAGTKNVQTILLGASGSFLDPQEISEKTQDAVLKAVFQSGIPQIIIETHSDFKDTLFKGSTVSELLFDECSFENCTFTTSMLENAIFLRCTLKNVQFINTNVEFIEFNQCRLQDVIMPFQQLPYVYGAYNHVANGDIRAQAQDNCLTAEKYIDLQEALITYYISVNEYFPLTNLYLARQNLDAAYQCITLGLQSSIVSKNFRMLKFYCKLAVQGSVSLKSVLKKLE